jgi:hypothetical protein
MRHLSSSSFPRVLLAGLLLITTLASSGCALGKRVNTNVDQRTATELREDAKRDLQIAAVFQVASLGLYAWAVGSDSMAQGDKQIMVTSAALTGLLSFGALYNSVTANMEAQQRAALRTDAKLQEFAREATAEPEGR